MASETIEIRPQRGKPQESFLATSADIAIFGGSAGGGKTWALEVEPLRHIDNPGFGAVIFRRTYPDITNQGGLWDESYNLYPFLGARSNENEMRWEFPSGAAVSFAHMQHAKDRLSWKGAQIPLICFDQLEEFLEVQFWYMLSRNRSLCGVRPYIRATCNPVPDDDEVGGWLCKLIAWWIDQETGYAIPDRSGVIRWFVRRPDDALQWGDSYDELREWCVANELPHLEPLSLTFIPASLADNPILEAKDPGYRAKLNALPLVDRERLLGGNWKIRPSAGKVFDRAWFEIVDALPVDCDWVRYWDKAGTDDGGAMTAGVKVGRSRSQGLFFIADATFGHWSAMKRENVIKQTAQADGTGCAIVVEQEPGSGGKESANSTIVNLAGFDVRADRVTGDKIERAGPMSAQAEQGNVKMLRGPWNEETLRQLHRFAPGRALKDIVDAAVGGFNWLTLSNTSPPSIGEGALSGLTQISPTVIE